MLHLSLPGRDESEPEDFEAQNALRTLLEGEEIKSCGDEDLLARISGHIEHNRDMLDRVSNLIDGLLGDDEDIEDEEVPLFGPDSTSVEERTDTRTIEDFLARINRVRKAEHLKNLQPLKRGKSYV